MKFVTFSLLCIFLTMNVAHSNCQWGYINELNKDIKYAGGLLSDYSICRGNCEALETELNSITSKMSNASACGVHILTRANKEMIDFISSRFRLIQKQKTGSTWAKSATTKPTIEATDQSSNSPIVLDSPALRKPQIHRATATPSTSNPVPAEPSQVAPPVADHKQTRMQISPAAYEALWNDTRSVRPKRQIGGAVHRKSQLNNQAKRKQLALQRLIQQRRQAQIQQHKLHQVIARKRLVQNHLSKQRQKRQQLLKKRALMSELNRKRHYQRKLAMAQRNRNR